MSCGAARNLQVNLDENAVRDDEVGRVTACAPPSFHIFNPWLALPWRAAECQPYLSVFAVNPLCPRMSAEDAALAWVVIPLGAGDLCASAQGTVDFHCQQHATDRRNEIDPRRRPNAAR